MPRIRRGRGSSPAPADRRAPRRAGRAAMTAPRSRQTRRSQTRDSSSMSWSTIRMPRPASRRRRSRRDQLLALAVGHAGGGLVEQQEGRTGRQQRAPGRRHASRLRAASGRCGRCRRARSRCGGRRSICVASSAMVPESARSRPLIDVEQRRLARAVGPDQPDDLAAIDREGDTGQRLDAAEALGDAVEHAGGCGPGTGGDRPGISAAAGAAPRRRSSRPARPSGAHSTTARVAAA